MDASGLIAFFAAWLILAIAIVIPLCRLIGKAKKYSGEN